MWTCGWEVPLTIDLPSLIWLEVELSESTNCTKFLSLNFHLNKDVHTPCQLASDSLSQCWCGCIREFLLGGGSTDFYYWIFSPFKFWVERKVTLSLCCLVCSFATKKSVFPRWCFIHLQWRVWYSSNTNCKGYLT